MVISFSASCASKPPLESLCVLDIENQTCWFNKKMGLGVKFEDILKKTRYNIETYCVDRSDLIRVYDKLNECHGRP